MKRMITKFAFTLCLWFSLPLCAQEAVHSYFRTLDIRNGLSQNTVCQILQDRQGFVWFGTKDGLNRYDGISFRIYKKENSGLGKNYITSLHEDRQGNIWIGTDGGVFVYNPVQDTFTAFCEPSDKGTVVKEFVNMIRGDEKGNVWMAVENQGLFCYYPAEGKLKNFLGGTDPVNPTSLWVDGDTRWVALYADNLYYTKDNFLTSPNLFAMRKEMNLSRER